MPKYKTKYHYFYKITNLINNHFYYGVHNTNNLDDGYMGSGKRLNIAYQKYGLENFKKEILEFFNTSKEAFEFEHEFVTEELSNDKCCYNLVPGGNGGWEYINKKYRYVIDKFGNHLTVEHNDPRLLSGELKQHDKGISKEYVKNTIIVKDKNGNYFRCLNNDPRYLSGEFISIRKGFITVKDDSNNYYCISKDDPQYISGILYPIWKNRKHSQKTKDKLRQIFKEINHQQGKKNSQFGTCWIHNNTENKKIKKEELENYINLGWIKGRKMKF